MARRWRPRPWKTRESTWRRRRMEDRLEQTSELGSERPAGKERGRPEPSGSIAGSLGSGLGRLWIAASMVSGQTPVQPAPTKDPLTLEVGVVRSVITHVCHLRVESGRWLLLGAQTLLSETGGLRLRLLSLSLLSDRLLLTLRTGLLGCVHRVARVTAGSVRVVQRLWRK
jgi:hypothetical protein